MQSYIVGGAVRDALLGLPVQDRDWVVVGAQPSSLLAQGYQQVGQDFPVFLHPQSHEEVALARTERKTAKGYHGFAFYAAPEVTLEQDLERRDLSINAMAVPMPLESPSAPNQNKNSVLDLQHIIDPYGGQADLRNKVLRHVSNAFNEDPVRILRLARFAARLPEFSVHPQTMQLMQDMVKNGEVRALVAERVWQEISRGLMSQRPSRMFEVLRACGALAVLLPELDALWGVPQRAQYHPEIDTGVHAMMVLDMAAQLQAPLAVRFACLCHDFGKGNTPLDILPKHHGHEQRSVDLLKRVVKRWKVDSASASLAQLVAAEHGNIHRSQELGAQAILRLLKRCDAFRRPERFSQVLLACECDARGRLGFTQNSYPQAQRLQRALAAAQQVNSSSIAAQAIQEGVGGLQLAKRIDRMRQQAIELVLAASA